ncbi:MAG: NAD(P)-dependent oxidoreductase [Alsobacter sp.]
MRRLLITGGAGHVGRKLRKNLAGRFDLIRVLDRTLEAELGPREEARAGDVADMAAVKAAMAGMDAVIHLAAQPVEAPFEVILQSNLVGTWNVYEAARLEGVGRVIFASSNHAVGFYPRTQTIDHLALPRPDSRYGLSKCFGEAVGALYADKYGVKSMHLRIGNNADTPGSERALAIWVSGRDLAQLVMIGLEHPEIHNTIVYGVSRNAACWYDNAEAYRLGYDPQDRAEDHRDAALAEEAKLTHDAADLYYQGGPFCSIEYAGDGIPAGFAAAAKG